MANEHPAKWLDIWPGSTDHDPGGMAAEGASAVGRNGATLIWNGRSWQPFSALQFSTLSGTITAWSSRKSAAVAGEGALMWCNFGAGAVLMRSDGALWRNSSVQTLINNTETGAGTGSTSEQIIKQITIPAGLLSSLNFFGFTHTASKVGTNGVISTLQYRIGTSGTVADNSIYTTSSWNSAATLTHSGGILLYASSATNLRRQIAAVNSAIETVASATNSFPVDTVVANSDTNNLILSLTVTAASAADTPSGQRLTLIGY